MSAEAGKASFAPVPEAGRLEYLEREVTRLKTDNAVLKGVNAALTAELEASRRALATAASERTRGRPKRAPDPGERVGLSLRVTPAVKELLEAKANELGRSISAEAEYRLENTFQREALVLETLSLALGTRDLAALVLIIGLVMLRVQRAVEPKLQEALADNPPDEVDRYLTQIAVDAGHAALEAARPEGLVGNLLTPRGAITATDAVISALRVGEYPAVPTHLMTLEGRNKPEWLTPESERLLERVAKERFRMNMTPVELWGKYWQMAERMGGAPALGKADGKRKTGT